MAHLFKISDKNYDYDYKFFYGLLQSNVLLKKTKNYNSRYKNKFAIKKDESCFKIVL